jgi:hypothetical protein
MPPTGANGENAQANDGQEQDGRQSGDAEYDAGRAKRMRYEENVIGTLQGVGICQSDAEEVWQAMGTFAKHGIMVNCVTWPFLNFAKNRILVFKKLFTKKREMFRFFQ